MLRTSVVRVALVCVVITGAAMSADFVVDTSTPVVTAKMVRIPGGAVLSVAGHGFNPGESVVVHPWGVPPAHGAGIWLLPPVKLVADINGFIHWTTLLSFPNGKSYTVRLSVDHSGSTAHPVPVRDTG